MTAVQMIREMHRVRVEGVLDEVRGQVCRKYVA
jgi:hypothetical protein